MEQLYDFDKTIKSGLTKIKAIDERTGRDVEEFVRNLELNSYSPGRISKYITFLKTLRTLLGREFREASKQDFEGLVMKLNQRGNAESTKSDFKKILKFYYRWIKLGKLEGKYPEEVDWIKSILKKSNEKVPEQILTIEDVEALANVAENNMKRAFVLCLYETGCRISEFLNIRIKDISFDQYGSPILVSGKTGWRRVRVSDHSKELTEWLDSHPMKTNPESYVWTDPRDQKRIFPDDASHMLKSLAEKSGITKACNCHAFRHARATHLANKLTEQQLKVYFGWSKNSGMASVYVHLSGEDVDSALLEASGIKAEKIGREVKTAIRTCHKCNEPNSVLSHFCRKCNAPLDFKVAVEADESRAKFDKLLCSFLIYYAKKDPEFKDLFVQFTKDKKADDLFLNDNDIKIKGK